MVCPNCGTENSRGQKFCTRCGTNLLAIDRAREIISEMTDKAAPAPHISPGLVFGTVSGISIFGFIAITIGVVELSSKGPISIVFGLAGFTALVLICRYFLKLLAPPTSVETKPSAGSSAYTPPAVARGATNRALQEAVTPYHSIIEEPTQQFEPERRSAK